MGEIPAVLCGYYGKGNGGDEALLASLLQMLPPHIKPIVLSGNPQETTQRYGVESYDRFSVFAILQALQKSDYFIWGGGSLMQDVTSLASPFYYGTLMALAQGQGLKTIAWAQGIGPLKNSITQWLTRQVLKNCTAISVRDRASAELLKQWNIEALLAPDPVWVLKASPPPLPSPLPPLPPPRVGVIMRPHPQLTPQRIEHLSKALREFQSLTQCSIVLIPFQPLQDLELSEKIAQNLTGPHKIIQEEKPRELKGLFQKIDFAIGMRLHSLIMAAAEGCRCFALSYDPKVTQLMTAYNLVGWELTEIPGNPEEIYSTWLEEYKKGKPVNASKIEQGSDRALLHQKLLQEVMKMKK